MFSLFTPLLKRNFSRQRIANDRRRRDTDISWEICELAPRRLLAGDLGQEISFNPDGPGIEIQARGETGDETIRVIYNDEELESLYQISSEWQTYRIDADFSRIDPRLLRIQFVNDVYDPDQGYDRNVQIGTVTIGDQVLDSNAAIVFSTGTWLPVDGVTAGAGRGSTLNANGYLQYDIPTGSKLTVYARGDQGGELMQVLAASFKSEPIQLPTELTAYDFYFNEVISFSSVRISFLNELYLPEQGIDHNLVVDRIELDGVIRETETPSTFALGVFRDGGLTQGYYQTERLEGEGYFQFNDDQLAGERYVLDPKFFVGELVGNFAFDAQHAINTENQSAVAWDFITFNEGQTLKDVRLQLFNSDGTPVSTFANGQSVSILPSVQTVLGDSNLSPTSFFLEELRTDSQNRMLLHMLVRREERFPSFTRVTFESLIIRVMPSGDLDASFGNAGVARVPATGFGTNQDTAMDVDSLDRVLVGSASGIARLTVLGAPDASFGNGGVQAIERTDELTSRAGLSQIQARPDRSIVLLWGQPFVDSLNAAYLIQLNEDGTRGTWYGNDGVASIPRQEFSLFSEAGESFGSFVIDSSGRIVVLGKQALIRFTVNGQIDPTFGDGGRTILSDERISDGDLIRLDQRDSVAVDGLGRYLINQSSSFIRLIPEGQIDSSFGGDGYALARTTTESTVYGISEIAFTSSGDLRSIAGSMNGTGLAYWEIV